MNITWNKYFDKIYFITHIDNRQKTYFQLKKVGILDSGILKQYTIYNHNVDTAFNKYIQIKKRINKNIISSMLNQYYCIRDAKYNNYQHILIIEDNIKFIDNLEKIQEILENKPENSDIILYNPLPTCFELNKKGIEKVLNLFETQFKNIKFFLNNNFLNDLNCHYMNEYIALSLPFKDDKKEIISTKNNVINKITYEPTEINICFSITTTIFDKLIPVIYSLRKYSQSKFNIYIILDTNQFNQYYKQLQIFKNDQKMNFTLLSNQLLKAHLNTQVDLKRTQMDYGKLIIPSLLSNVDKIIYLDYDILIRKEGIEQLWNLDIKSCYIAAASDLLNISFASYLKQRFKERRIFINLTNFYFNTGVMLMNLREIRKDSIDKKMLNILHQKQDNTTNEDLKRMYCMGTYAVEGVKTISFLFQAQSLINYIFQNNKVRYFSAKYNNMIYDPDFGSNTYLIKKILKNNFNYRFEDEQDFINESVIIHFSGKYKPWKGFNLNYFNTKYQEQLFNFYNNFVKEMKNDKLV